MIDREAQTVRLLVVEDDEEDFLITRDLLGESETYRFDIDWLDHPDTAYESLLQNRHDLCLMDFRLGLTSGVEIVGRAVRAGCSAPIIMLTGQDDTGVEIAAADAGAVDYLTKDGLTPELLLRAIRYALVRKEIQHEQDERRNAEAANRSKSEFLANLSHEIRTPLTAIVGFTDLLITSQPKDPLEIQEKLQSIRRNSKHLLSLLNDTLDLSKIEAGALELESGSIDLREFVTEVLSINSIAASEKCLSLKGEFLGRVPRTIESDETRLRQIILNLISNAIKFTHKGSVRLTVCIEETNNNPLLKFNVIDTGIGISEPQIEQIFSPYQQVGDQSAMGTGLGLTISRRLTEMLGGRLTVSSIPGEGSTFTCFIDPGPINTDELEEPGLSEDLAIKPRFQKGTYSGRLLVVDDVADNRQLLKDLLATAGFDVTTAINGIEALEAFEGNRSEQFDLVLLDLNMPKLDGYSTLRELRKMDSSLLVLAMTAGGLRGEREKCLAMGFTGYVSKPFKSHQLLSEIQSLLLARSDPVSIASDSADNSKTFLVIEDNEDANRALSELLQLSGHNVFSAHSGAAALEYASRNSFDSVICDIHLGDWNGIDLVSELKKTQANSAFYIMSGADKPVVDSALPLEYVFIEKPVTTDKLLELGLLD